MSSWATVMRSRATVLSRGATAVLVLGAGWTIASAQAVSSSLVPAPDWYHVGNSIEDLSLAGLATGAVDRVWYSGDGSSLYLSASGKTFETNDFEKWQALSPNNPASSVPAVGDLASDGISLPEPGARLRSFNGQRSTMYAFGTFVYQSTSGGASWDNVTGYRGRSIVGPGIRDLAVSPRRQ
jgi:hypothetical protein